MRKQVLIQINVEGFHNYPDAPKEVSFLSYNHRHTFNILCGFNVTSLNREKEIFLLRDYITEYLTETYGVPCNFDDMSCEMIAQEIIEFAKEDGISFCEVWEEQTGGARIEL